VYLIVFFADVKHT